MRSTMGWIVGDLAEHAWAELPHLGRGYGARLRRSAALGGVVATRRRGPGSRTRGAVMDCCSAPSCARLWALTWGLTLTRRGRDPELEPTRQTLKEITGRKGCGVGDFGGVVTDASRSPRCASTEGGCYLASPDAYSPFLLSATVKPFGAPVWGTFGTTPRR